MNKTIKINNGIDTTKLIIENDCLSILKKRLIQNLNKQWIIETYKEPICLNILLPCKECIFYKNNNCEYQKNFKTEENKQ